jgi:UDP:flavonoid glycosyltransferase YjiC (YdhE family)
LTAECLAQAVWTALVDPRMRLCTDGLGAAIRTEDGVGTAVALIERWARNP